MKKDTRNIIIAVIFLVVLLVEPFWGPIKSAVTGEDAQTGASPQAPGVSVTVGAKDREEWLLPETQVTVEDWVSVTNALAAAGEAAEVFVMVSVDPMGVVTVGERTGASWSCTVDGEPVSPEQRITAGSTILWTAE